MNIQKKYKKSLLAAFALAAAFFLCACGDYSGSGIVQNRRGSGTIKAQEAEASTEIKEAVPGEADLYILVKIDEEQKTASFQNTRNGRQSQYEYDTGTRFLNKYGDTKPASAFLPGDAVEVEVSNGTQKLSRIQLSGQVWIQDEIENYSIDQDIHAFIIGNTKYAYDPEMEIFSGDVKVGFESISDSDMLRAVGIDKKVLSLSVARGHGYLALANTKLFEGSFICVGDRIFQEVTKNMKIEVPEGEHVVTVANNGYGGSKEVVIERNQTISLNLDELKGEGPKICKITFDVGVEGAVLWIDGKKADYSAPVELTYGVHSISVEAEGYDTITKKLVANSAEAEIEIALTEAAGNTSAEEGTNTDSNANGGNNSGNSNNGNNNNGNNNNGNNNNGNDNNGNNNNGNNSNSEQDDYLTTLYNLLTSINKKNSGSKGSSSGSGGNSDSGGSSNSGRRYDDLRDE